MTEVFITGVTGFLGRHLAVRLLRRADVSRLWCLVRATDPEHGRDRLQRSLSRVVPPEEAEALASRLRPVVGDLTVEGLGLAPDDAEAIVTSCDHFLHAAADVRFNQGLEDARLRNVFGTEQVVAYARRASEHGQLKRLDWVGTAFVAGLRPGPVGEHELEHDAGWRNSYEQTKYEAEVWLRRNASDLPLTVFRPAIIVGESTTGATSNFGMLYWPVQIYARGWWRTVVGSPQTTVDLVPVDFVADAIDLLSRPEREPGGTFHLAAGVDGCRTIEQLAGLCQQHLGGKGAKYVDPRFFMRWVRPVLDLFLWGKRGRVLKEGGAFFVPYFTGQPTFDTTRAREALAAAGLEPPSVETYFSNLLDYCVRTDFGRNPPPTEPVRTAGSA